MGGGFPEEGRVEFCDSNEWGTVCDDSWDTLDAIVVCRQLGFSSDQEEVISFGQARFGQGSGPIFLDDVHCFGRESRLADCIGARVGSHDCSHSQDAGVRCMPATGMLQTYISI